MPDALAEVATVLLILAAIGGLVWARFSYRATTWILSAAAFVGTVAVVRWLNEPAKLAELLDGRLDTRILGVRYTNLPLVLLLMVTLPLILVWMRARPRQGQESGSRIGGPLHGGERIVQTTVMLDEISDKSIKKATEAVAVATMVDAGEPIAYPIGRRAGGTNGGWFTYRNVLALQEEGRLPEIEESDIYPCEGRSPGRQWRRCGGISASRPFLLQTRVRGRMSGFRADRVRPGDESDRVADR